MAYRDTCVEGDSCSNLNVTLNLWTNPSHAVVSLRVSNSKYQFLGIVSNMCMNQCIHSIFDTEHHKALHFCMRYPGSLSPVYFYTLTSSSSPKCICMSLLHCAQSLILFLCTTHHLDGVVFKMTSSANNLCY
jgi:hypothetical protein